MEFFQMDFGSDAYAIAWGAQQVFRDSRRQRHRKPDFVGQRTGDSELRAA
ncbi:hypothetical protein [Desulfobotulus mexicanus]|nr:hypothetical protein [Desulfobotulus mexicanus]